MPNPCQNGGTCTPNMNMYTCTCVGGYSGVNCEIADSSGYKATSEKAAIIADYGRLAASLGFDAIHVEAGTPMLGGGTVGRTEYVVLNRAALIAEGS